jgi:5-methyltetrahydropteroyltriglutamate--homocysteine methyltransferase
MTLHHITEHVGSLIRPPELTDARNSKDSDQISLEELRVIEDFHIIRAIEMQEMVGMDLLTDGEYRRGNYMEALALSLNGFVAGTSHPIRSNWRGPNPDASGPAAVNLKIVGNRLKKHQRLTAHETIFLQQHTKRPFKVTMPSPTQFWLQWYQPGITDKAYPTREELLQHIALIIHDEVVDIINEGGSCIQLDATSYIDYVDAAGRGKMQELGIDLDSALDHAIAADNFCLKKTNGSTVSTALHICRGNKGGNWRGEGGYDAVAEKLFNSLEVDRILLEYDTERAGGFEPLRYVPKGLTVVLGLITTKSARLESEDLLLRRIEEASKYIPIEQLSLSPQCGFASNPISWDDQQKKLELVVDTTRKVWG